MANIYKDSDKRRKVVPGGTQAAQETFTHEEVTTTPKEQSEPSELLANLKSDKPTAKSYAFYLSDENVNKLREVAKQQGVSASKLLDHILTDFWQKF